MDPSFVFTPIRELGELIESQRISPIELTELFLERLEKLGRLFNAVVTVTRERALEQARRAEKEISSGKYLGPLHGIPYGAKDLLATQGIPTTWGAAPFENQFFDYEATVIRKLDEAGAVLTGKLAMIELAGGMGYRQPKASFTGPPRNPWNTEYWTGGSSSGSGAAVSAGLTPFAIGSETWGSILSPANNCGISGLRPTYGRVSRFGAMALSWTLDKIGPLCLTADDCGIVLEAISGSDPKDSSTSERCFKYVPQPLKDEYKLAVIDGITEEMNSEVVQNFEESIKVLEKFSTIESVNLPELPYEAITRIILYAESASAFEEFINSGRTSELTAPEDHYGPYPRMAVLATDYLRAMRLRNIMCKKIDEAIKGFDAVIAPTRSSPANPIDEEFRRTAGGSRRDVMGAVGNGAGLPSISVPNGFSENGLPTGIQFMGNPFDENTIIAVARKFQSLTDWQKFHPDIGLKA
jgi:aspartyl-tRNA(Asn)/glutamyl-tRNA(Gln) amidotransferase subunit A